MQHASALFFRAVDPGGVGDVDVSTSGPSSAAVWGLVPGEGSGETVRRHDPTYLFDSIFG